MSDLLRLINQTTRELEKLNLPDSYRIAREIVTHYQNEKSIKQAVRRISRNEPWEYIRGYAEFNGIQLKVNKSTLIPRIETEQILKIAQRVFSNNDIKTIVDVGTGSGAIILSLYNMYGKKKFKYIATDISQQAVQITKENCKGTDIQLIQSDLLENIKVTSPTLLIANLPYIPTNIYKRLEPSVREYEPRSALDGGKRGIEIIERLLIQCSNNKMVEHIILEIDPIISDKINSSILKNLPKSKVSFIKDFRDQIRFVLIER